MNRRNVLKLYGTVATTFVSAGLGWFAGHSPVTSAVGREPWFPRPAARAAIFAVLPIIALSFISHDASSQSRTIKVIVPFPAGGTGDLIARVLGEQIGRTQGVIVVIENRRPRAWDSES